MNRWLLLDSHYLCYRAFHTTGHLSYGDVKTGITFGFLRDVVSLQDQFDTTKIAFCFDSRGPLLRQSLDCDYKANRREVAPEAAELMKDLRNQITTLRDIILPAAGYSNVFWKKGYEADDIIATLSRQVDECVIVSSDEDLFQLLGPNVSIWNPHKKRLLTAESFTAQYGIAPDQWVEVKAIAGCIGDNVVGIKGVGEKTAIKFIVGKLKPGTKAYESIVRGNHIWEFNRKLVTLPFPGLPSFELREDDVTVARWRAVCDEMGLQSLRSNPPLPKALVRKITHGKR